MKTKEFFRPIFREAWVLTRSHKGWWVFGFLALFLMSSFGYQAVLSGLQVLTNPELLLDTWLQWSVLSDPASLIQGQFETVQSNPSQFFTLSLVWLAVIIGGLAIFLLSVFGVTMVISGAKQYLKTQRMKVAESFQETFFHLKSVTFATILAVILSNVLIVVFSIPVIALGANQATSTNIALLVLLFGVFLAAAFFIAIMSIFTVLGIVLDDYTLSQGIQAAWGILKRHLVVTIEMFLLHVLLAGLLAIGLVLFISLLIVPVAIIGPIFVAAEQFSIAQNLPTIVFALLYLVFAVFGAVFTLFQLLSWSLFYHKIDDIKPYSRIATLAEATLRIQ